MDISRIEDKIDKAAAGATAIDMALGGVRFQSMIELMEFAKMMAVSDLAVPFHLRGNPGACLAVCTKALRFGFDPFSLAEHSYRMVKREKDGDQWINIETIAYDSFVIRAIINAHAPIQGRIKYSYDGEGEERICTAMVVDRGTGELIEHVSPTLGELKVMRGRNDKGQIKGSPLWDSPKSDNQLSYDTGRDLCRINFPEVLLGVYDKDELEDYGQHTAKDVTPKKPSVAERLNGQNGRGFSAEHVERETAAVAPKPQQQLAAPTEQPIPINAEVEKKLDTVAEQVTQQVTGQEPAAQQQAQEDAGNPLEIPPQFRRSKKPAANKAEPKQADQKLVPEAQAAPAGEEMDETAIVKTLLSGLEAAKQASIASFKTDAPDDGLAVQRWSRNAANLALRKKLSKEKNAIIDDVIVRVWDEILK